MENTFSAEDLVRIEKSNKAMEILAMLPVSQRSTLIEGFLAAMQLSDSSVANNKNSKAARSWFSD